MGWWCRRLLRNVHRRGCVHGRFGQSPGDEVWPSKSPPHSTASLFWNTICEPAQLETACTTARRRKGQEVIGALAAAQGNPVHDCSPLIRGIKIDQVTLSRQPLLERVFLMNSLFDGAIAQFMLYYPTQRHKHSAQPQSIIYSRFT